MSLQIPKPVKRDREKDFIDLGNPGLDDNDNIGKTSDKKYALFGVKITL